MPNSSVFENCVDLCDRNFYDFFTIGSTHMAAYLWTNVVNIQERKDKEKQHKIAREKMSIIERASDDLLTFTQNYVRKR